MNENYRRKAIKLKTRSIKMYNMSCTQSL